MVLNWAQGLKKKIMKFQREKITTGWDITKNVEGADSPPPALLGLRPKKHLYMRVTCIEAALHNFQTSSSVYIIKTYQPSKFDAIGVQI